MVEVLGFPEEAVGAGAVVLVGLELGSAVATVGVCGVWVVEPGGLGLAEVLGVGLVRSWVNGDWWGRASLVLKSFSDPQ